MNNLNLSVYNNFTLSFPLTEVTPERINPSLAPIHSQHTSHIPITSHVVRPDWMIFLSYLKVEEWWRMGVALAYQIDFSAEDLRSIFNREALLRQALDQAQQAPYFQVHPNIVNLYAQVIKPLLNRAKSFLVNRAAYTTIVKASEKGLALRTGIEAIQLAIQANADLWPELSSQEVYLLPPFSVIKKRHERGEEEESLMEALFSFKMNRGVLSSTKIECPAPHRWGISLTREDLARGYSCSQLQQDPILETSILKRIPQHLQDLYDLWGEDLQDVSDNLDTIRNCTWTYQQNHIEEHLTIYQLWERYQANLLNMDALIQPFNQTAAELFSSHWQFRASLISPAPPGNNSFTFSYQQPTENVVLSFQQLRGMYLMGKLNPEARIQELNETIQNLILKDTDFGKALTKVVPALNEPFLTPAFPNEHIQKAFERCEKQEWIYQIGETLYRSSFKQLFNQFTRGNKIFNLKGFPLGSSPTDIKEALSHTKWKLIMPELYFRCKTDVDSSSEEEAAELDPPLTEARSLNVKPFLKNMILLEDLIENAPLFEAVMRRIDERSQYKAFLTSLFQCLDLYDRNIGVAPCSNAHLDTFKNIKFTVYDYSNYALNDENRPDEESYTFDELQKSYLLQNIHPDAWIIYHDENGHLIMNQLKDLKDLIQALESQWEWVFFDFDLCLGESNSFQKTKSDETYETLIPLRSAFLSLDYKHHPLNAFTLAHIENSDDSDAQMEAWIKRLDTPIRKRLSKNGQKQIDAILDILLQRPEYSISQTREADEDGYLKTIQARFANDLAEMQDNYQQMIWKILEQELSQVSIYANETYESLAKRHKQEAGQLRSLNQHQALIPGCKAKIFYSLTAEEDKKKRIEIGKQLFPRLTWKQQKALSNRQAATKNYLQSYRLLQMFVGSPQETLSLLEKFIYSPLFSKNEARRLAEEIKANYLLLLANPYQLQLLKDRIQKQCQPTLFNLMAVMYPHLKDSYALASAWIDMKGNIRKPGDLIGNYNHPLEKLIQEVQANFPPQSDAYLISQILDQAIKNEKDPYLFFVF